MKQYIAVAMVATIANAAAEPMSLPLEHVLVSVPLHKKNSETALPVTVFSRDQLRQSASTNLGAALQSTPGLANASFGPAVGQPVIRGQQGPRVTVLQNGTRSADASSLSADHAVSVEPLLAQNIEVLRGPATLLYGGGAIGGVVNVLDNRIPTSLTTSPSGGIAYRHDMSSDMDTAVFSFEGAIDSVMLHMDGLYRDWNNLAVPGQAQRSEFVEEEEFTEGYIANTGGRTRSLTLGGSYHFDGGFIGLAVNELRNEYGIPGGAHGDHEEHEEHEDHEDDEHGGDGIVLDVEQTRYDVALHWHTPLPSVEVVRGFLTYTDYEHAEIEGSGEVGTLYSNDSWEGRLEMVHQPLLGLHGVLGLQLLDAQFSALGEEAFVPKTDSTEFGLFILEDYHWQAWTVEAGLRFDRATRDPNSNVASKKAFNAVSASASMLWDVSDTWQLGIALSRAERAPATEELFSNVEAVAPADWVLHAATNAIELGNAELNTEVSRNADFSVSWQRDRHWVAITVFYNDFTDYINLRSTDLLVDGAPVLSYMQSNATFYGVEIDSELSLGRMVGGDVRLGIFGDSIRGELATGSDVPRLPPQRVGARLSWAGDTLKLWGRIVGAARQARSGENEAETDSYTRLDLGANYRVALRQGELALSLSLNNLGDEEIRLSTSFLRDVAPEAGRSLEAGFRLDF